VSCPTLRFEPTVRSLPTAPDKFRKRLSLTSKQLATRRVALKLASLVTHNAPHWQPRVTDKDDPPSIVSDTDSVSPNEMGIETLNFLGRTKQISKIDSFASKTQFDETETIPFTKHESVTDR
jgi:hypothetical protein